MKWLVYISFFVCLLRIGGGAVVTGVPSPEAPPIVKDEGALEKTSLDAECLAGSEWESNCHYCRCSDTGVAECLKQSSCVSDAVVEPIRCKPNTTFLKDCNTCVCLENGQGLCSITECLRLDPIALSSVPKKSDLKQGKDCAPGTRWTSQCNQCQCSSTGEGSCTKKACIGVENAPLLSCAPGSMWRNDCNTCRCTSDGIAMCTLMGCDRFTESESKDEFKTRLSSKEETPDDESLKVNNDFQEPLQEEYTDYVQVIPLENNYLEYQPLEYNNIKRSASQLELQETSDAYNHQVENFEKKDHNSRVKRSMEDVLAQFSLQELDIKNPSSLELQETSDAYEHQDKKIEKLDEISQVKRSIGDVLAESNLQELDILKYPSALELEETSDTYNHQIENFEKLDQNRRVRRSTGDVLVKHSPVKRSPTCKPNQEFDKECNICRCSADGQRYSCTQNECMEKPDVDKEVEVFMESEGADHVEQHSVCKPRGTFYIGCNTCHCNFFGTDYSCTNNPCPLPQDVELFHELKDMKPIIPYKAEKLEPKEIDASETEVLKRENNNIEKSSSKEAEDIDIEATKVKIIRKHGMI